MRNRELARIGGEVNVEAGVAYYLDAKLGVLRPKTWAKYRMTLLKFATAFAGRDLDSITNKEVREWRTALGIEPSSANKYVDRVKAMYVFLGREDQAAHNPAAIDRLDEPGVRRVRLPHQAIPAMVASARHPRDRAIIVTALELLLRGGELAELRVGDVLDGSLRVMVEKQKGELQEDEMAISGTLQRELAQWLRDYRVVAGIVPTEAYLFPRLIRRLAGSGSAYLVSPTEPMAHPEEVVKLALRAAGYVVPPRTGVHAIRRTCARLLHDHLVEEQGADRAIGHISALMHHSSRRTTELYLGITGDRVLRNKLIRHSDVTPLTLAMATTAETAPSGSAQDRVYDLAQHTV